ncbi:MAG: NUDIX domain-containing protein [Planctomycetota bacterium]
MTTARHTSPANTPSTAARIDVVLCVLLRSAQGCMQVLVARRALDSEILPGAWELPGGKIAPGERARDAGARELLEEVAVDCTDAAHEWQDLGVVEPPPPEGRPAPRFHVQAVQLPPGAVPRAIAARSIAWVSVKSLAHVEWPATTRPAIDVVIAAHGR